jgi:hypothetical protein
LLRSRIRNPVPFCPGSGKETSGSGINIPDPQHNKYKESAEQLTGTSKGLSGSKINSYSGCHGSKEWRLWNRRRQIDSQTELIPNTGVSNLDSVWIRIRKKRCGSRKSWVLAPRKAGSFLWSLVLRPSLREEEILYVTT